MPETPEDLYARAKGRLRTPAVKEWDTWPFTGAAVPRVLEPPVEREPERHGEGGVACHACKAGDDEYVWTNANWRLAPVKRPTGLPLVVILESREHYAEPGDLPDELAAELGVLQAGIDRAIRTIDGIGRVHIGRWGDGAEHLHVWFLARPARLMQLLGSFAAIWDDILPPTPQDIWDANLQVFLDALGTD